MAQSVKKAKIRTHDDHQEADFDLAVVIRPLLDPASFLTRESRGLERPEKLDRLVVIPGSLQNQRQTARIGRKTPIINTGEHLLISAMRQSVWIPKRSQASPPNSRSRPGSMASVQMPG
ncbi:hypothetical protein AC579_2828 [Pseudocercospora musae]|uniref:Uncharacterized protein n=1 Tax=Pseudocercospora musae TaxID=113226 RepID=A0A139IL21_9PEZI|nr:hypothetical protein AC579_2828 [Pseudocercospora musae]